MSSFRTLGIALACAVLTACDRSSSATGADPEGSGGLSFALPAALRSQVGATADSLRVELRHGSQVVSRSAALDSAIRVDGLEAGMWGLSVGLYQTGGVLAWYGEDSVRIRPGQVATSVVTLHPAKGSVDIVIRLDTGSSSGGDPTSPLLGDWYLWQVDSVWIANRNIRLHLGDTGNVSGDDGCNSLVGSYMATATSLRFGRGFLQTEMYCSIYETLPSVTGALLRTTAWTVRDSILQLRDSLGRTILTYERRPPQGIVPPPLETAPLLFDGPFETDTTGSALLGVRIDSALATDSGALLTLVFPHPGVALHLFVLDSIRPSPPTLRFDTVATDSGWQVREIREQSSMPLPQEILVAGSEPDSASGSIQVLQTRRILVPWRSIQFFVAFLDRTGRRVVLNRPGWDLD